MAGIGAAMAFTEWAGTFAKRQTTDALQVKGIPEVDKVIDSVGKLRGPALLIVASPLLSLGSSWVAASVADSPPKDDASTSQS